MTELFFQAPTSEEVAATYKGMTFDEFKLLDDAAIEALRFQERTAWLAQLGVSDTRDDPADECAWIHAPPTNMDILSRFIKWRTFGVPDRGMPEDEFLERMYHYADTRRANDPTYGQLEQADFAHLTEDEMELAQWAIDEAWDDGVSMKGQPTIDPNGNTSYVADRVGVTLDDLVTKGILEPYTIPQSGFFKESTGYVVTGKIAMYLFSQRYPEAEQT